MHSPPVPRVVSPPDLDVSEWAFVTAKAEQIPDLFPERFPERPPKTRGTTRKRLAVVSVPSRQGGSHGGDRRSVAYRSLSLVWQWRKGKGDGQWVDFAQGHQYILEKAYAANQRLAHFAIGDVKYEVDTVLEALETVRLD